MAKRERQAAEYAREMRENAAREGTGAVDLGECPKRGKCKCGTCSVCGFQKHTAIHGPSLGQPPGSKPYDHEYHPTPNGAKP